MQNLISDLTLNLLAEGVGILVTVFLIDLTMKRREAKRWLPARKYAHAYLMRELDKFLSHILGSVFEFDKKGSNVFYEFGDASVFGAASYKNYDPINVVAELNSHENLYKALKKPFSFEPMRKLLNTIKNSILTSSHLLEPELCSILISLDNLISEYLERVDRGGTDMDKVMSGFPLGIFRIVTMVIDARIRIEQEADKVISASEGMAKARKQIDEASKFFKERYSPK